MTVFEVGDRIRCKYGRWYGFEGIVIGLGTNGNVCSNGHPHFQVEYDDYSKYNDTMCADGRCWSNDGALDNYFELISSPNKSNPITLLTTTASIKDERKKIWARCDECQKLTYVNKTATLWLCNSCIQGAVNDRMRS